MGSITHTERLYVVRYRSPDKALLIIYIYTIRRKERNKEHKCSLQRKKDISAREQEMSASLQIFVDFSFFIWYNVCIEALFASERENNAFHNKSSLGRKNECLLPLHGARQHASSL